MRRPPASRPTQERTGEYTGAEPRAPRPRHADDEARAGAELLKALADPTRLHILDVLSQRQGDVCVCDLEGALPVKQPTVSHHLRLLREAGLIDCERRGLWAYYFVRREAVVALRQRVGARLDILA